MNLPAQVVLMASYNTWMNAKVYEAAGRLSAEALAADRGAFFGSVLGTLNHLVVADTIWLKRFAEHPARHAALDRVRPLPAPSSLDQLPFEDFAELSEHRRMLDATIEDWAAALTVDDLAHVLRYTRRDETFARAMSGLLMHFFNHQTHHRGQATTLLTQAGIDVGVTDLVMLIPNQDAPPT